MEWVVRTTPRPLYPREVPGTHCIEGWVGPRTGLDGCGKSHAHRDSIPGPSSSYQVAIATELSVNNYNCKVCNIPEDRKSQVNFSKINRNAAD